MITCQRDQFFLPEDLHYLNCAYMAPLSRTVERAGIDGLRQKRDPSHIGADDFFEMSSRVRELFGRIVGAPPETIAIIPAVSYGLATIAGNLPVRRGENIIVLEEQFPSNVYVWKRLAGARGASIRTVASGSRGGDRSAIWNDRILEAIDAETAIVALPHVHWTDGTKFDLETIADRTRDVGAALVIDATQSAGALPIDVGRVRPDALVCAGYKWLMGPYSIGAAYIAPRHHDGVPLEENWIARRRSEEFSRLVDYEDGYQPGAARFDVGERSNFILVPMFVAALEQVLDWGAAEIQDYCGRLVSELLEEARSLGYLIEQENGRGNHLFGIRMPDGLESRHLREELGRRNVSVSVRGSAVRVSPHVYNHEQDVAELLDALRAAMRVAT